MLLLESHIDFVLKEEKRKVFSIPLLITAVYMGVELLHFHSMELGSGMGLEVKVIVLTTRFICSD